MNIIDNFLRDVSKIPSEIFEKTYNAEERENFLANIFDALLSEVLNEIITNESNIFQSLIYKLYLFKLSILD